MTIYLTALGVSCLTSWLLTAWLLRAAPRLGLIDHPSDRKVHEQPTPRAGGLAIYAGVVVALGLVSPAVALGASLWLVLAVGLAVVLLGALDDRFSLPWSWRLGGQTAAALAVLWPEVGGPWLPLAVLWVVGLVNAFNMLDNMDALSAGTARIAALVFAAALVLRSGADLGGAADGRLVPYLALVGALSGFLWFNKPPARIFMGDAGSTFLGFFLGVRSLLDGFAEAERPWTWAVPLCGLAVPWYDLVTVVALRLRQGRSPFHADKQHYSHRLVSLGLSRPAAVRFIHLTALTSGVAGLAFYAVTATGAALLGVQLGVWWLAVASLEYLDWIKGNRRG